MIIITNRYKNLTCPVCDAAFPNEEEAVVCPVCGAPHHRTCWDRLGHCTHEQTHGTDQQWSPPPPENNPDSGGDHTGKPCPQCRRMVTPGTLFCPSCGHPFHGVSGAANTNQNANPFDQGAMGPGPMGSYGPWQSIVYAHDPFGGVDPSDTIEGIPVSEAAQFVAVNTPRYIPLLARSAKGDGVKPRRVGWNWGAFFFPVYWLFYRKCYGVAAIMLSASAAAKMLLYPFLLTFQNLIPENGALADPYSFIIQNQSRFSQTILLYLVIGLVTTLLVSTVCGLFGDYIYSRRCINRIKEIKSKPDVEDIHATLNASGGVSLVAPALSFILMNFVLDTLIPQIL